jgi:hypothetical protein
MEHLIRDKNRVDNSLRVDPNYNNAVYKFVIERFHKKYNKRLNEKQKKLLTKYAIYMISENKGVIKSAIEKEVNEIKQKLRDVKDSSDNLELVTKLNECYKKVVTTDFDVINEKNILEVLQYMRLVEELDS